MKKYLDIVRHYENCFKKFGDTPKGVDWPNEQDLFKRYSVMMKGIPEKLVKPVILDFGCGNSMFFTFLQQNLKREFDYFGLDISQAFVDFSCGKFPDNKYICADVLDENYILPTFDFAVLNGVFTEKSDLSHTEMYDYMKEVLSKVFTAARSGIAFNVMSKNVDWERDDLFHVSLDQLTEFLCKNLSRHFVIRNDYGLYEYTVYLYKPNSIQF